MIKMAIIGFGGMANWHFENIGKKIPEIKVAAAYDIRQEAKDKIVKSGLKSYSSPEELYADGQIDLVLIATPNDTHMPYARACLSAGKHVICEKPVALNAAELAETIEVSRRTGRLFTVHQNRRWDSDFLTIKKILDDGLLTGPYTIESRVQGSRQGVFGWRAHKINGGGMLLDWGIHLLDQLLFLFPRKVVSVAAHLHSVFNPEVDDNFTALLRFDGGMSALVNVAMNCFILQPRWHMCCEDGTAVIENWECGGKIVKLKDDAGEMGWAEEIVYTAAGPTRSMAPRPKSTTLELPLPLVKGDWTELYRNILAALDGKAELIVKPEQSLRVMKVVDAVFEADRVGGSLKCEI